MWHWYEPRHEETFGNCDRVKLKPACSTTDTWNFGYSKLRYYTIQAANNKSADHQTGQMHRLSCAFVVRIWHKQIFPIITLFVQFLHHDAGIAVITAKKTLTKKLSRCFKKELYKSEYSEDITLVQPLASKVKPFCLCKGSQYREIKEMCDL